MSKNIGIMGGSFDPIHNGHLIIAERAREEYNLDKIIFIPTGNPPHKENNSMSDAIDRYNMTDIAIKDNTNFCISDIETNESDMSYTINTLNYIKNLYVDSKIYFILGGDSLLTFHYWKDNTKILEDYTILVANRDIDKIDEINIAIEKYNQSYPNSVYLLNSPLLTVSSTYIRKLIVEDKSIKYLVPDGVNKYIVDNKLYKR